MCVECAVALRDAEVYSIRGFWHPWQVILDGRYWQSQPFFFLVCSKTSAVSMSPVIRVGRNHNRSCWQCLEGLETLLIHCTLFFSLKRNHESRISFLGLNSVTLRHEIIQIKGNLCFYPSCADIWKVFALASAKAPLESFSLACSFSLITDRTKVGSCTVTSFLLKYIWPVSLCVCVHVLVCLTWPDFHCVST